MVGLAELLGADVGMVSRAFELRRSCVDDDEEGLTLLQRRVGEESGTEKLAGTKWMEEAAAAFAVYRKQLLHIQALQVQREQEKQQQCEQKKQQIERMQQAEAASEKGSRQEVDEYMGSNALADPVEEDSHAEVDSSCGIDALTGHGEEESLSGSSSMAHHSKNDSLANSHSSSGINMLTDPSDEDSREEMDDSQESNWGSDTAAIPTLSGGSNSSNKSAESTTTSASIDSEVVSNNSQKGRMQHSNLKRKRDSELCEADYTNDPGTLPTVGLAVRESIPSQLAQRPTQLPARGDGALPTTSQIAISHILRYHKDELPVSARLKLAKHLIHNVVEAEMYNVLDDESRAEFVREFAGTLLSGQAAFTS